MSEFEKGKTGVWGSESLEKDSESLEKSIGSEIELAEGGVPPAPELAEPVCTEGSVTFSPDGDHPVKPAPKKQPWLNGHRWKPGQSGNPAGRPKYIPGVSKVKVDRRIHMKELFSSHGEGLIKKAIEIAMEGKDTRLLSDLLKYCTPQVKDQSEFVDLELPPDATAQDRLVAIQIAVTSGKISPESAAMMSKSIKDAVESEKILQAQQGISELQERMKTITGGRRV